MRALNLATMSAIVLSQLAATPLMAQDNRNLPPPGYPGDSQEFEGTLRCASYNNRPQSCSVNTENRVVLLQRESGNCRQNYDWGYDRNRIWVNNRCVAVFGYGYAPQRPQPPSGNWGDRNFAGTLQCVAQGRQQQRCYVNTQNRVELLREDSGRCTAGQSWGYTNDFIWVSNRCSAVFGYGNAYRPQPQPGKGPSAGAIIGGVIVAGGLLALLASSKKKSGAPETSQPAKPEFPPQPPAAISADLTKVQADARPTVQNCLFEAARQIGATGGSRLKFERATQLDRGNGGWRLTAAASATYPDGDRSTPFFCRATPTQVIELSFTP